MNFFAKSRGLWITVSVIVLLLGVEVGFSFWQWDWLREDTVSAAIRNVGLVMAATIALPLAVWRGIVADKQSTAAQEGLRNERYQKGAEMLGSEVLSVRMAGIYALQRLAEEYPEEYHVQIMQLFCAFVRYPIRDELYENQINKKGVSPLKREDVEAVMQAIGRRNRERIAIEQKAEFYVELQHANLYRMFLFDVNLSGSMCHGTDFSKTTLVYANLSNVSLRHTNLSEADLEDANISGADFRQVRGLTQKQLNQARAYKSSRPRLEDSFDAETGEELKWEGGQGLPL